MLIKLESASFLLRLVRTDQQHANLIAPVPGGGAMCMTLLQALAEQIDHLGADDLLSLETTLSDLLVTCLAKGRDVSADDSTSVQLGHLRRIYRTIEAQLGNAELSLDDVARHEGLSTRYLQKLFKVADTTFTEYLKQRRLERCRLDLANRALDHFTVAELCFRWGFNDAANFSRAFSALRPGAQGLPRPAGQRRLGAA